MNKFFTAIHKGGLKECLETEQPITEEAMLLLVATELYSYYGYDERIDAHRYLLKDMDKNIGLPTWINVYKDLTKRNKILCGR